MISIDVISLHTNIPIIDTLNIIKDNVNNDDQFTRKTAIPQKTDGIAMGDQASSTTAEIYMQAYERTAITTALHPPKHWE